MKVGSGEYTYELIEDFAKLPEGQTFGLISRVTSDAENWIYVFQRKDPAVLIFDRSGKFLSSWGNGVFKRAHGFKIVGDRAYVTDQTDSVAMIYTLDGKLIKQIGTRGAHSDTGCEDWHNLPLRAAGPFNHPTEMLPSPSGDLYVTDGYRNSRVHRFNKDGELIQSWGSPVNGARRLSSAAQPCDCAGWHRLCQRPREPARPDFHARRQVHRHVDRHGRAE